MMNLFSEDNKEREPRPPKPNRGPQNNKPDGDFDWSKIIRMVFGWGAVLIAAIIVVQLFQTDQTTYTEVSFKQYQEFVANDKVWKASVTKTDINDYFFKGDLRAEELININGKDVKVKNFTVYLPEPIIEEQKAVWVEKGINYTFEKQSNEWMNIILSLIP